MWFTPEEIRNQPLLFADAIGLQECITHGEFDPHAFYSLWEIERMVIEDGVIDCYLCLVEIDGSG